MYPVVRSGQWFVAQPVCVYIVSSYSETRLSLLPLVPLKAAQLIQVATLRKPLHTTKMELCNYHLSKVQLSEEIGGRINPLNE